MKNVTQIICFVFFTTASFGQKLATPSLSPFSKISQQVGLTEINVEYSRPSAKGREVYGKLVHYGKIWRTGANASTKIILTESAEIGGKPIAAGTYALYTIPGFESWTIIIQSNTKMRGLAGDAYKQGDDVFRFEGKPENPRYGLLKAKIQKEGDDLMPAIETVNLAYKWAVDAGNNNYIEQTG